MSSLSEGSVSRAGKQAGKAAQKAGKAAQEASKEVLSDIKGGQDGLGSIVKVVSKKSERADTLFHMCNGVGCDCADRLRVPIMLAAVVVGIAIFVSALCGAFGLMPHHLDTYPWGAYIDVPFRIAHLYFWVCGSAAGTTCQAEIYHPNNTALFAQLVPACWASISSASCAAGDDACACNAFLTTASSEDHLLGLTDWKINQWGMCLFPLEGWILDAIDAGNIGQRAVYFDHPSGGRCLPWKEIGTDVGSALDKCREGGVDAFSLIMGTFGGFMKMFEPLSRLKRSTDQHQKTVILLIVAISTIPPILGIVAFSTGCLQETSIEFRPIFGKDIEFGLGAILFSVSLGLMVPVAILHIIVPAGATTARVEPCER